MLFSFVILNLIIDPRGFYNALRILNLRKINSNKKDKYFLFIEKYFFRYDDQILNFICIKYFLKYFFFKFSTAKLKNLTKKYIHIIRFEKSIFQNNYRVIYNK